MNPSFLTGFTDGEGCFTIIILRNNKIKVGWEVQLFFQIIIHTKDKALLEQVQSHFAAGTINKCETQSTRYRVSKIGDLAKIIAHFDKFSLITKKRADYELWKKHIIWS